MFSAEDSRVMCQVGTGYGDISKWIAGLINNRKIKKIIKKRKKIFKFERKDIFKNLQILELNYKSQG